MSCAQSNYTVAALLSALLFALAYYPATATAYTWGGYPTPLEACEAQAKRQFGVVRNVTIHGPILESNTSVRCTFEYAYFGDWPKTSMNIGREGDPCVEGELFDTETGACVQPPKDCKAETGDILTRGTIAGVIVSNGRTYSLSQPPASACVDSCGYSLKDTERPRYTSCYFVTGSQVDSFCNYILTGTGESCSGWSWDQPETGDPLNPPETPDVPPSDPSDPGCPKGWSWSGTTCVKTPNEGDGGDDNGGDKEDPSPGGGSGGGSDGEGGSDNPGGEGEGPNGGSGNDKDPGSGTGGGKDPEKGSSLKPPKAGSFDNANKEWDAKAEQARQLFNDKLKQQMNSFKGVFDVNLGQGAGSLPCERFTVLGQTLSICLTDYATELAYLRQILLLVASVIAATIVLRD